MINPNPPQVLQTLIPSASVRNFPEPPQQGQKIMPYFSGSILPPFAFLSIPIPLDSFGQRKTQELQATPGAPVFRNFYGREIFSFLSPWYSWIFLSRQAFKRIYIKGKFEIYQGRNFKRKIPNFMGKFLKVFFVHHPLRWSHSGDQFFRSKQPFSIKKCWICQSNKMVVKTIFLFILLVGFRLLG